jgi:uncharacterized protein YbaP (TraB family)
VIDDEITMRLAKLRQPGYLMALALTAACMFLPGSAIGENPDTALFWQIEKNGREAGFLLGTIHSEDPRVLDFSSAFLEQLKANDVFAMEMVPDLPTLTALMEFMHYQDGTTLESVIGSDRYQRLLAALAHYRMPESQITHLKLWAAVLTLSVPPPQSGLFMDFSLSLRASGNGMKVVGLETLEQQLSFFEAMPGNQQLEMLDDALTSGQDIEKEHQAMVDAYLRNDLQYLVSQSMTEMEQLDPEIRRFFVEQGIVLRNRRMAERLLQLLSESTVFAAVGSLHLPGEYGLIELLRSEGYQMKPMPMPFISQP